LEPVSALVAGRQLMTQRRHLKGNQKEAFKRAVEDAKLPGQQFMDLDELEVIFDDIVNNVKP
jgi:hypothetical protein